MDVAQSFVLKGPMPKTGRWFSWHQSAEVNLKEFHAAKMLLQWYFPSEPDPEESTGKTLASSFKDVGGLKLVYRCMTRKVYELSHVLLAVSKPCWTWYTFQVEEVKTASEQIGYNVLMSEHWMHEPHLCHIASFLSIGCTEFQALMRQSPNEDELVSAASKYVTALLSNRAASFSKHDAPPYAYAGLLATDEMLVRRALRVMREDFTTLVQLETSRLPAAKMLADDLQLSFDTVTRLICHQFEHNGWTTSCREGHRLLQLIFGGLGDNKCIEDLHKFVRKKQKAGQNEKLTLCRIQKIINEAPVISERRWLHTASVDRLSFLSDFRRSVKGFRAKNLCYPSKRHKLPPRFSRIMKKNKTWKALSEKTLAASSAGWAWAREYKKKHLAQSNVRLKDCSGFACNI